MGEHIKLTPGNVLYVTAIAVIGVGAVGATTEFVATKTNIPVITPLAKGLRVFLGWSFKQV